MIDKRIIKALGLVFGMIIIGSIIYLLIPRAEILFQVAPEQVKISINGKEYRNITNGDKISLSPGKYKIIVYRDEFDPAIFEMDLKNHESKEIVSVLTPLTENAKKLLDNERSGRVIEKFTAMNMDKAIKTIQTRYPIVNILPIENRNYAVRSCASKLHPGDMNKIALCVDIPSEEFKLIVKDDIKARGFNPDEYEYIWNNYLSGVE